MINENQRALDNLSNGNNHGFGNLGNDRLYGSAGEDVLWGDHEDKTRYIVLNNIVGAVDPETDLMGGKDWLFGYEGTDIMHGGFENDKMYGGADRDEMFGEYGDDILFGGDGDDVLWGDDESGPAAF